MKRFLTSLTLCLVLLIVAAFILSQPSGAAADPISQLLDLPAPPPPNPLVPPQRPRDEAFFSDRKVPADDAPIGELLAYWRRKSSSHEDLRYSPTPTPRVLERLKAEIERDPDNLAGLVNIFSGSREGAEFVKRHYDNMPDETDGEENEAKSEIRSWLVNNSPYFTGKLERAAGRAGERGEYVTNQDQLLTLAKYDWEAARPTVDRLYGDAGQPVSRVLATWALYTHALEENSLGDIDRYRDELKAFVEDKKATAGMRDLAFDALVKEPEWSGRDDWYYSLLADETLADLRVNGTSYTGLTTIILRSHPDKYADKMIELIKSSNPVVRAAAARNLTIIVDEERPDVIKALLPALEDPNFVKGEDARQKLLRVLQKVKVPESVPGLLVALDEKEMVEVPAEYSDGMNNAAALALARASNAVNSAARAVDAASNSIAFAANNTSNRAVNSNVRSGPKKMVAAYPLRQEAISALATQEDMRAVPALRRILKETREPYARKALIRTILRSKGYSVIEQANAVESYARSIREATENPASHYAGNFAANAVNTAANAVAWDEYVPPTYSSSNRSGFRPGFNSLGFRPGGDDESMLGLEVLGLQDPGDLVVREVVARITANEKSDPQIAATLRTYLLVWNGSAVNSVMLKDLRDGKADTSTVVKLLSSRKELREKHGGELFDLRTAGPFAAAVGACIAEAESEYTAVLDGENVEKKAALLACGRLVRAKIPVDAAARFLTAQDKRLALAAERFLESEDSPRARAIVLSHHPNEARIMGATTAFWPERSRAFNDVATTSLLFDGIQLGYQLLVGDIRPVGEAVPENRFREELKSDEKLSGIYSYQDNTVRIYKDRVMFSWGTDDSRYYERPISKDEFAVLTGYLADHGAEDMSPFIACEGSCEGRELLMLGRNGGRRVFLLSNDDPDFFRGLSRIFGQMKAGESKLRYRLESEVPGLEILLADDGLDAKTVWAGGGEVKVVAASAEKRKEIEREIRAQVENDSDEREAEDAEGDDYYSDAGAIYELREKRQFDDIAWYKIASGRRPELSVKPPLIDIPPSDDGLAVAVGILRWKQMAAGVEIRASEEGGDLFKVIGGKLSKFKEGSYSQLVISSDGKWAFATKESDAGSAELVRIDLATGREYRVLAGKDLPLRVGIVFVPSVNKLLAKQDLYYSEEYGPNTYGRGYFWVDPRTGAVTAASGDLAPLAEQTFRPLQPGPQPFEFWTARYDQAKNATVIGLYDTRKFAVRPVLSVPKIRFTSMEMWVDAPAGKAYFVYNGHLLSIPMPTLTVNAAPPAGATVR